MSVWTHPSASKACRTLFDRRHLHGRIRHDPALPYLLAAGFELRLDQDDDLPATALR